MKARTTRPPNLSYETKTTKPNLPNKKTPEPNHPEQQNQSTNKSNSWTKLVNPNYVSQSKKNLIKARQS